MWDLAVREEDYTSAAEMIRRYRGEPPASFRLLLARAVGDSQAVSALLEAARHQENRQLQIAARYLATYLEDFALADLVVGRDLEWRQRPAIRQDTRLLAGWLALARGRWGAARAAWDSAEAEGAATARIHRAVAAALPFVEAPAPDLARVRGEIAAWDPARDAPDRTALATALRPHLRLYLLGLLDSRMGRPAEALARATDLERLPPPQEGGAVVRALAATVRADAEWARGRAAAALGHLEGMQAEIPLELLGMPAYVTLREYGLEHAQYLRAAALAALGRNAEARRWLELGLRGAPNEIAFRAPAALLLADLAARAGDTAGVARHLDRVAALWAEADPPLRARMAEARGRLTAR